MIDLVLLSGIPLPPSSNNQYCLVRRGNKTFHVPSLELKVFQRNMQSYPHQCENFLLGKNKIQGWVKANLPLKISAILFFKRERIFTKKKTPKKMDISNRIKALHDCICELLEIDDSVFFNVSIEKAECHENLKEMACIEISPF